MRKDNSRIYTVIGAIAAIIMGALPELNEPYQMIVTGVLMLVISVSTLLKQRISVEVDKRAQVFTWILIGIAIFGGANDLLAKLHEWNPVYMDDKTQEIVRKVVAGLIAALNLVSKMWFPSEEAGIVQETKNEIKASKS